MKSTMLYIAEYEKDVQSFLEYLNDKLISESRTSKLDLRCDYIETDNYMIIGKSLYCGRLGTDYGYMQYYTISSKLTKDNAHYRDILSEQQKCYLDEILMHTRADTREISELEMLYVLGLV